MNTTTKKAEHATKFSDGTPITSYLATGYAEGFEEASDEDQLLAWGYLIATGLCWSLRGWFGRTASSLIENGVISKSGKVLV